jgi:hypothetical protein
VRDFDTETYHRTMQAVQAALQPIAAALPHGDTLEWRGLVRALLNSAEMAHPGPWRLYLADACGLENVPDAWRNHFGPHVQIWWDRQPGADRA